MVYALINNGIVENIIVADEQFIASYTAPYEHKIRIDQLDPRPGIGWLYDGNTFSAPTE